MFVLSTIGLFVGVALALCKTLPSVLADKREYKRRDEEIAKHYRRYIDY